MLISLKYLISSNMKSNITKNNDQLSITCSHNPLFGAYFQPQFSQTHNNFQYL